MSARSSSSVRPSPAVRTMYPPGIPERWDCSTRFSRSALVVGGDLARHADVIDRGHVNQEAARQRDVRGDAGALLAERLLGDLNDDFLALAQQIADGRVLRLVGAGFGAGFGAARCGPLWCLLGFGAKLGGVFRAALLGPALVRTALVGAPVAPAHPAGNAVQIARTLLAQGRRQAGDGAGRLRPFRRGLDILSFSRWHGARILDGSGRCLRGTRDRCPPMSRARSRPWAPPPMTASPVEFRR